MKTIFSAAALFLIWIACSAAYGGVPPLKVTVSDQSGKAAFTGATDSRGLFATANLKPGTYVVQFNSKNAAVQGDSYAIVVSAGKKKVVANAVRGEKFAGGGVAMKVEVGKDLNVTGQVVAENERGAMNGKEMVWIPAVVGGQPGHWAEANSAEAKESRSRRLISKGDLDSITSKYSNPMLSRP